MVGFAVELNQLDIEFGAHRSDGVLAQGQHRAGEQAGDTWSRKQGVLQQRHAVWGA
nr:hypothetical protein [Mycobacterium shinjukuense]